MRILLVVPMVPRSDGPGAIPMLLEAQLAGLTKRHEVTLVSTIGDDLGEAEAAAALIRSGLDAHFIDRRLAPTLTRRTQRRLRLAHVWATRPWPWRTVWFAPDALQGLISRLGDTRAFDVAAIEDSAMSVFRFPAGVPTVLTEHEAFRAPAPSWRDAPAAERPRRLLEWIDWRRFDGFQHAAWRRFDLIQVFGDGDAGEIAKVAPDLASRVRTNPFGIVLPAPLDPAAEDNGLVLFVGNFTHPPNRDAALWLAAEIMPALRAANPAARLRLVGNAPPPEVLALAGPGIEVVANAPSIEPHLAAAAVVLAPVRTGGGMRMKVLEALARRKAVVTTTRGTEGYTGFEAELPFIVADHPGEIAGRTAQLLAEPERRRELGRRARQFAERHYSPDAWAGRLEAIYAEAGELRG
jgi:glycosyltransferase involved in cell wall biosynthesis